MSVLDFVRPSILGPNFETLPYGISHSSQTCKFHKFGDDSTSERAFIRLLSITKCMTCSPKRAQVIQVIQVIQEYMGVPCMEHLGSRSRFEQCSEPCVIIGFPKMDSDNPQYIGYRSITPSSNNQRKQGPCLYHLQCPSVLYVPTKSSKVQCLKIRYPKIPWLSMVGHYHVEVRILILKV